MRRWIKLGALALIGALGACSQDAPSSNTGGGGAEAGGFGGATVGSGGAEPICLVMYTDMPAEDCDIWLQDCPAGMRCGVGTDATGDPITKCLPPKGTGLSGASCMVNNHCEHGLACVLGRCEPVCCPDTDYPCGPNGYCIQPVFHGSYGIAHCMTLAPCELFDPQSCVGVQPAGHCHVLLDHAAVACVPESSSGVVAEGEPCSSSQQCGHAQRCWAAAGNVCRYNCALDGSGSVPGEGACPAGQICTDVGISVPNVGLCVL
jgi:hypothetical protein